MKKLLRLVFVLFSILLMCDKASAFEYDPDLHMQVIYEFCGRDLIVTFVYHQSEGDDDRMLELKFINRPISGGADQTLIDFRHLNHWPNDETGLDTIPVLNNIGARYAHKFPGASWNIARTAHWFDAALDGQGARKYYIQFHLYDLPQSTSENFFFSGTWDGEGSNSPNFEFSSNNTFRNVAFGKVEDPSNFMASSGQCDMVTLNWVNNEDRVCAGYTYYFRILRDNVFLTDYAVANISQTSFTYVDNIPSNGTSLPLNQHTYKLQLILKNNATNVITQSSMIMGPATGNPLPDPLPPTQPTVTYPNCTGTINLNWQNGQVYSSVVVTLTPSSGSPITETLDGSPVSHTRVVPVGPVYIVTITGRDACNQSADSPPLLGMQIPQSPGSFIQFPPIESNGIIYLSWTQATGAASYTIIRESPSGNNEFTINDGSVVSYQDSSVAACTPYMYRIIATNTCGNSQTAILPAPIVQQNLNVWSGQKLSGSKGYFGNRVTLEWESPNTFGFNQYRIYRKPLGSPEDPQFLATIDKNALSFQDFFAYSGILYEYSIVAASECNGVPSESNALTDIGFRLPIATVSGNVKFENGTGVSNVEITVERNAGSLGKGLHFDGQGLMTPHLSYVDDPVTLLPLMPQMTIELWIKPDNLDNDFSLFQYVSEDSSYGLYYDADENAFIQYYSDSQNAIARRHIVNNLSTTEFTHISWTRNMTNMVLYVNGLFPGDSGVPYSSPGGTVPLTFGEGYTGYLDEIRFWDISRTLTEIRSDFGSILTGEEDHLLAYWRIDEGIGSGVYDISGKDESFHGRHMSINAHVIWTDEFPLSQQLGNVGMSDSLGNYIVRNIRYSGVGSTFTVIPFLSPQGTPHEFEPTSMVLFLGEGNNIQNGVNFTDKSSFLVTGTIKYLLPDSLCDNTKALVYIDGQLAIRNGQPVTVVNGTFSIDVPIGLHRITVRQDGHVFANYGSFPPDGGLYDFQKDETGITFFDSTTVRVIGRVAGGTREGNKKLGHGLSKNNIGIAEITFTSQLFGCHETSVRTDSLTGEYMIDLLPVKYDVAIDIPHNLAIDFAPQDVFDLTIIKPLAYEIDTIYSPAGQILSIDSAAFNVKQNYIYREAPSLDLVQAVDSLPLSGDSVFVYVRPQSMDTSYIPLDMLPYPAFLAGKPYGTMISAFELYINKDNSENILEDRVPVTDGRLTIRNGLGNSIGTGQEFDEFIDLSSPDGDTIYTFIGGQPEFVMEGNQSAEFSFTKTFEVELTTPDAVTTWLPNGEVFRGYVLGSKPVEGSSFITEGPELVDFVLRDPPGDGSTTSITEGTSFSTSRSWFVNLGTSLDLSAKIKIGTKIIQGGGIGAFLGFETENAIGLETGVKLAIKGNTEGNLTETTTFEHAISTSSDPYFTGTPMDLFIGNSTNFLFGKADELGFIETQHCGIAECFGPEILVDGISFSLAKRRGLFMVPQGFNTTFAYSVFHIKYYLIPNLEELRNNLFIDHPDLYVSNVSPDDPGFGLNNDDPYWEALATSEDPILSEPADESGPSYTFTPPPGNTQQDDIRWYNQQIRLWKEAMADNEREKVEAETIENISFDAGATVKRSETRTKEETDSRRFELAAEFNVGGYIESDMGGSGSSAKYMTGIQVSGGTASVEGTSSSTSYSYELADGQPGDFFSIDVKKSKKGHSPIFSLRGGQSMCPWEQGEVTEYYEPGTELSVSTIRRELPDIDVEPAFQANVPEHQPARFRIKMRNASPTGEIQWYGLRVIDQTNPFGASLSIDGASPNRIFEVPAGETIEKTLELHKADSNDYEIKLMLYSTCEYEGFQNGANIYSTDTITISAHFVPACSPVSIRRPVDLWVHNVDDGKEMEIQLQDYLINDPGLENLRLQYKPSFTSTWQGIETLWKTVPNGSNDPQIPPGSMFMTYLWNIEELPDGPYDIRVVSHCTNTDNDYPSPHVTGIVDRIRPHAFGNPQPADGVLDPNDEIMIQFNEVINPASIITSNFDVRAVLNGSPLRHETSVELDGINDFVEIPAGTRIGDQTFSIELWLKRSSNGAQLIWSQGEEQDSSMAIGFNASNILFFRWHTATITSTANITNDGLWHHIAITCNESGQVSFYHTGETAGLGFVNELVSIPGNMVFGKAAWAESDFYKGNFHEARIWRTELTLGAIRSQMLKRFSGAEPGLSTLWPMDEGMGDILHDIVRKKNAKLQGSWSVLPSGSSYAFSVNDDLQVDAGTIAFSQQHSFTMEFWLKAAKNGNNQTILSNGKGDGTDGNDSGWAITANAEGNVLVHHGGQQFEAIDKDVLDNNWHHIAIVINRQGNLNTYLDGALQSSMYGDGLGDFGGAYLWIASRGWYEGVTEMHDQYFNGALDEIRVWNTKLTAENIRANMLNRLMGDEFGLMLYLPFETYSEIGGIPTLTQSLFDQSPYLREIVIGGNPDFQAEDPNIKLVAPFEKVNFTYSINGDKIIITPTTDPLRIERTVLYISLKDVEDIYGNEMAGPINWTAFVNKNQLQWSEDELYFEKPEKEVFEFTSDIVNSGGIELSYEILGLPEWLTATPSVGTISPVSSKTIHFEISPNVLIGDYSTDVNLLSGQGYNDKLAIDLHVFGVPPAWNINPANYSQSMIIVADLKIDNELSDDPLDRVAAYINGEVRGLATLQYMPPPIDRYLVFLEVYSNVASGEQVSFKVWDAGTGTTYAGVNLKVGNETNLQIPFVANSLVGNAVAPANFIVTNDIIQEIPLNAGWTWISFNVLSSQFGNLNNFFAELNFENNDLVQNLTGNQMKSAAYNPSTGWQGNLVSQGLDIQKMYQCDFTYQDILRVVGPRVNPNVNPISISTGINWIPMLSSESIEINEALSSFAAIGGDWVKSQNQLAVFHPTQGWVGTLQYMEPGKGYILYSSHNGSIIFPFAANPQNTGYVVENVHQHAINWRNSGSVDLIRPQERNMTVIARLDGANSFSQPPLIAAFASGYLLQTNEAIPLHEGEQGYYYFTLQGYENLGPVYFEIYDASGNYLGLADEKIEWSADNAIGDHDAPFILHLSQEIEMEMDVHPNPFKDQLYISLETAEAGRGELFIYDAQGKVVHRGSHHFYKPGLQFIQWDGDGFEGSEVPKGAYFIELILGEQVYRETVIRQ